MRKFYKEIDPLGNAVLYSASQPEGFEQVTDPEEIKALDKKLYKKRTQKGIELFEEIRIDLFLKLNSGDIDSDDAYFVAEKLSNAKSYLITGDWIMAIMALQITTPEGAYTEALRTEIIDKVNQAHSDLQDSY